MRMRSNLIKMKVDFRPRRTSKTFVFLAIAVLANSVGNLMLAVAMERMPAFASVAFHTYLLSLVANPFLLPGAALSAIYAFAQLSLFSWADLSFVIPCTAVSYIFSTLLAEFVLGEHVQPGRWVGVLLIFLGVALVARTPVATKAHPPQAPTC
jgi:drug/metabolite transporter (DMT)-like permease